MYIDSYRVALLHRGWKCNSPDMLHAVLLELRVIVLHTEIMFYTLTMHAGRRCSDLGHTGNWIGSFTH